MVRFFAIFPSAAAIVWTSLAFVPPAAGQNVIYWSEVDGIWRAPPGAAAGELLVPAFEVRGIATASPSLVWTDLEPRVPVTPTGVVRAGDLDGQNVRNVATDLPLPSGVAIDPVSQTVYWSDLEQNTIYRQPLDGSGQTQEVLSPMMSVTAIHAIDIDPVARKLYFGFVNPLIDSLFPASIARINLDGTKFEPIAGGLAEPRGVAVNPADGFVYWTDVRFENGVVQRAALDGGEVEDLVTGLAQPRGIALDLIAEHIYWADAAAGLISRANLDGSDVTSVLTGLDQPHAIALLRIPEPATLGLAVVGALALVVCVHRRWN